MSNKYSLPGTNKFDFKTKIKDIFIGEVVSTDDPNDMGRIKIRIKGEDDSLVDADLPYAFPMIPKFLGITPQVKEAVLVFVWDKETTNSDRLFIGPIISQPQNLGFDPLYYSALAGFSFGSQNPSLAPSNVPSAKGVYADKKDFAIQGRGNNDIIFKDSEILIRSGKFVKKVNKKINPNNPRQNPNETNTLDFEFNAVNPGYIQIKYDAVTKRGTNNKPDEKGTITNIISSKINLLTHSGGNPRFNLANQDNLISDEEMLTILSTAHQVPFGDILLQYLKLLKDAFLNHVHNGNGNNPTDLIGDGMKLSVDTFRKNAEALESQMLSNNIRIN